MATNTAENDLVLTPPEPVKVVSPDRAAGLVPLQDEQKSQLEARWTPSSMISSRRT